MAKYVTNAEIIEALKSLNEALAKLDKQVTELEKKQGKLITCPACKGNVSNKAQSCPNCGHPIQEYLKQIELTTCPECGKRVSEKEIYCPNCEYPVINLRPHSITLRAFIDDENELFLSNSYDPHWASVFVYQACGEKCGDDYRCSFCVRAEEKTKFYLKCNYSDEQIDFCESEDYKEEVLEMTLSAYDEWWMGDEIVYEIGYIDVTGKRVKLLKGYMHIEPYGEYLAPGEEFDGYEITREKIKTSLFVNDADECEKLFAYDFDEETGDDDEEYYSGNSDDEFDPSSWDEESYLRSQGYTVSQTKGLSDYQRSKMLEDVLKSGVMSKYDIISHLERMINLRKNMPQYSIAISKWKRDIEFVRNCAI